MIIGRADAATTGDDPIPRGKPGLAATLSQRAQESLAIFVVHENILALIAAVQDLLDRSRVFHSQFARHRHGITAGTGCVNSED